MLILLIFGLTLLAFPYPDHSEAKQTAARLEARYREARVMRHTRVAGDPATELAPTHRDERAAAFEPSASNR